MKKVYRALFWILAFIFLTLIFGRSYGGYAHSFYFVSFLFPVIIGTSYLFNSILIPRFLFNQRYFKLILYGIYTLVFSVYLELIVITVALVLIANYKYEILNPRTTDIIFLTIVLYFFVFLNTILLMIQKYFSEKLKQKALENEKNKLIKGYLIVRSERKYVNISFDSIEFIEGLGNYVKIHSSKGEDILTKETIGIVLAKLPDQFLRIHRSIVVNRDKISSFSKEYVSINKVEFPISRTYKESVLKTLKSL